jgi:GNAT superfamily N-acetyltransferase
MDAWPLSSAEVALERKGVGLSTVRIATPADVKHMVPLINAAFAIETFLGGSRTDEQQLAEMMRRGAFLSGYDAREEMVATVYVEVREARGYLGMLAVSPPHQNRGFGRAMMDAAEEHCRARGSTVMDLTVLSLRPELAPFYAKCGYIETGREEFRPSRPLREGLECQLIVMSKQL